MTKSSLEIKFEEMWLMHYPNIDLHSEFKFCPTRRFRFDFAHLETKIGIEINGGVWAKSGHSSGTGLNRDYEKINCATSEGWRMFILSGGMITEENIKMIATYIQNCLEIKFQLK